MPRRSPQAALTLWLGLLLVGCGGDSSTGPTPPANAGIIALASTSVSFAGIHGGANPVSRTIGITAGGSGSLTGLSVEPITYTSDGTGWLQASLDKTAAPATLTLSAATGTIAAGRYTATVRVAATDAKNTPQTINVSLVVLADGSTTTLLPGQTAVFLDGPSFGTQLTLQPGSQYLIAVVNTNPSYTMTGDFMLAGALMGAGGAVASVAAPPEAALESTREPVHAAGPLLQFTRRGDRAALATTPRLARQHLTVLEANRQVYARRGNPRLALARRQATGRRGVALRSVIDPTIGTVNKVYVGNSLNESCIEVDSIGARTVAVGQHVIVLADTNLVAWPQSQRPDSAFYQAFADEFDQVTWPHTQSYIGDPVAYDASLSNAGKVTVTFTPVLNNIGGGVVAYVTLCDFFPFVASGPDAAYSNETEMIYSWVPHPQGLDVPMWQKQVRATIAHETKHVVSIASRIINNSPVLEEVWLEEGTAQLAEEIWLRHFNTATWKGHADFFQTIACEWNLGSGAPCDLSDDKPMGLAIGHLPFLFDYLQGVNLNAEGLGKDVAGVYGAGWAIARWVTDVYASDEAAFVRALINEPALSGLPNLSSHAGQPAPLLLTHWNMATAIFEGAGSYGTSNPLIITPSFDFWSIFQIGQTKLTCGGQRCGYFTQSGTPIWPLQPKPLAPGGFGQTISGVPGTAGSFFLLTAGAAGTQALQLANAAGGSIAPSSAFRVGILRVR